MPRTSTRTAAHKGPTYLTRSDAQELVDARLKTAIRELSRELEQHLKSLHERLLQLEQRP
mgnify:CR=1 FL=1|jgi:hypothetical protein